MVALAIAVLIVWQLWYPNQMEKARRAQEQLAPSTQTTAPGSAEKPERPQAPPVTAPNSSLGSAGSAPTPAVGAEARASEAPKQTRVLATEDAEWLFTSAGGGVERVTLKGHQSEGGPVVLNPFGGIPLGALTESFENPVLEPYVMEASEGSKVVVFRRVDPRQLEIEKRFTLLNKPAGSAVHPAAFEAELELVFRNQSKGPITLPGYVLRLGSSVALHARDLPIYTGFSRFVGTDAKFTDISWFEGGGFLGFGKKPRPIYSEPGAIGWAGVTNQYYCTLVTPKQGALTEALARRFPVSDEEWVKGGRVSVAGSAVQAIEGAVRLTQETLGPGQEVKRTLRLFAGPREHRLLAAMGGEQEQLLDFGMFGFVSRTLLASMNGLRSLLGSYAGAIVVLTIIIKLLMWPLQNKATNSMKRMQELQPKMNDIKERYGDDPQRMNMEIMALYKKHGVNPMSGCLPMLIQIPIFFGFYNMLGKAVELRNSAFLWVNDLSQPDTVAVLAGYPVNVLPLLMAATMLWQMQLSPKTGDPMQQRMFMFMPLIFIVFCYNFASALALYWTVQNLFSIVQLTLTNAKQRKLGVQSAVASPGRGK